MTSVLNRPRMDNDSSFQTNSSMPSGNRVLGRADIFADLVRDVDGALVAGPHHLDEQGGLAVELDDLVAFLETIHDLGDVTQQDFGTAGRTDRNLGEVPLRVGLPPRPDNERAALAVDGSGRHVDREPPDRSRPGPGS